MRTNDTEGNIFKTDTFCIEKILLFSMETMQFQHEIIKSDFPGPLWKLLGFCDSIDWSGM